MRPLAAEFSRYILVGGSAFLVDFGVLYLTRRYVFGGLGDAGVYLATALGFIAGLVYNYFLSLWFVFRSAREDGKGKSAGAFALFAVIGGVGLLLTEGGMALFYQVLGVHYLAAKVLVGGLVLLWNYGARKLLIFR